MEFIHGALAGSGAVIISNPFDVIKTRMQLQGELKYRGGYNIIYKNVFHAFYSVIKVDGVLALYKGFPPAVAYQIVLNGVRLGLYQRVINSGIISNCDGSVSTLGSITAGAGVGIVGGFLGSPFYLIKTQLQAQAHQEIAVGHQHHHKSAFIALKSIFLKDGLMGLWRGSSTSLLRVGVGSATQLFTYSKIKDWLDHFQFYDRHSWQSSLAAAFASGLFISSTMSPFDVVATRVYNQALGSDGKGLVYRGIIDCLLKTFKTEGIKGFYKGWTAIYLRVGPHSFFNLLFWDALKNLHSRRSQS